MKHGALKKIDAARCCLRAAIAAALVCAVGAADARAYEREEAFQKRIPLQGAKRVVVTDSRGNVKVIGEKGRADILCEFTKRIRGRDQEKADRLFSLMDITVERDGVALKVSARYPDRSDSDKNIFSYLMQYFPGMSVDINLTVPADLSVKIVTASGDAQIMSTLASAEIMTSSGDVEVAGVGGDLKVDMSSGDMVISNVSGSVFLNSASGDIEAHTIKGNVAVQSASGDVGLSAIGGDLTAAIASGDCAVDGVGAVVFSGTSGSAQFSGVRGGVIAAVSTGDVEVSAAPSAAANYEIRSSSGTIELRFERPVKGGFALRARTTSGDFSVSLPLQVSKVGRNRLEGVVREGKSVVVLETASGDIIVSEAEE